MRNLGAVVEGPGDRDALKILLDRLLREEYPRHDWQVSAPKQAGGAGNLLREGGLERFVYLAAYEPRPAKPHAVLVLLDGDVAANSDPANFVQELDTRVRALYLPIPVRIALAQPMYETWLVASIETTAARLPGHPTGWRCPPNVEELPHPDKWLDQRVRQIDKKFKYLKTRDQAAMTRALDFARVDRRCRSFREFKLTLSELLDAATLHSP